MIDLGVDQSEMMNEPATKGENPATTYPTLCLHGLEDKLDLPSGEFYFMAKGKVSRHTETTDSTDEDEGDASDHDYDIQVMAIKPMESKSKKDSGDGLDEALTKIEQEKADQAEDDSENE